MSPPDEDGVAAWLRYGELPAAARTAANSPAVDTVVVLGDGDDTSPVTVAGRELVDGFRTILGQSVTVVRSVPLSNASSGGLVLVIGTLKAYMKGGHTAPADAAAAEVLSHEDGYWVGASTSAQHVVLGHDERGVLYGAFAYLSRLAQGTLSLSPGLGLGFGSRPSAPIRWVNQWDNMDGSIERGYGGRSLFFADGQVRQTAAALARVRAYARLLASVGLNGVVVNNVNADASLLTDANLAGVQAVADTMRPYGVRVGLALNFDAPRTLGGLATADPLDAGVEAFWADVTRRVYGRVPDLLGYTIKANSEGQPGPLSYGRTLAEGANVLARPLQPHGGLVLFRAFVYDHHLREEDPTSDRANAAVDFFAPLDGAFADNVVVQVKFGPIDFQVREPPSPLLARLRRTPAAIEFMVAQEYMGQQSHAVYLAPQWQEILAFDMRVDGAPSRVRDLLAPDTTPFGWATTGYTAVVNVGSDPTWLGHYLAMANLYAYGRLAWRPADDARDILEDWIRLTFGAGDAAVVAAVSSLLMDSWPAYEGHSGNLGVQTLCDILYTHYGPSPASQDGNGWGQWTRADSQGIGMDRTVATGTGNAGQYHAAVAAVFEDVRQTPDDLLLWFHHVPYTHVLRSGKTVIQHFYDAHYAGAATVQTFPARWAALRGKIDDARFAHVAFKLAYQAGHALVWRDSVCRFYRTLSGIDDAHGRVNNHMYRIPLAAPSPNVVLDGYKVVDVTPPEAASHGRAVQTAPSTATGTVTVTLAVDDGVYDMAVNYYDTSAGRATYELLLNSRPIGQWAGNLQDRLGHDFSAFVDGHSATRVYFRGVALKTGDSLAIVGHADGNERAPLDYVSILPEGVVD
ncbi:hypothetical protein HMPREF1624_07782 [Sporothrix schenckii ATCC 58251]|uniref:Alpha-glucuronidase n=1 Tax=Sporothrix schenckii (strain ATCC 58251 / de Perez 2211183) TaxID=1391915 RepID=U7PJI3_SPOS1|nr:hypothetical protein HMPREF1624_07782 [Sporothrix schenckii ATCC 58251]